MDFAPVVVELCRALELVLTRILFEPFSLLVAQQGQKLILSTLTLGQMRALVQDASEAGAGGRRNLTATALRNLFERSALAQYAFGEFLHDLGAVNELR